MQEKKKKERKKERRKQVTVILLPFATGIRVGLYLGVKHMSHAAQDQVLEKLQKNQTDVVVATDAFGLGVDFIFRRVVSFGLPFTIQSLWQRFGRAGRDQKPATTCLYWCWKDTFDLNWVTKGTDDIDAILHSYQKILQ